LEEQNESGQEEYREENAGDGRGSGGLQTGR
jgi:hypothetical protein